MRALRHFAAGLLAALIVGGAALAVTTGGFPSQPTFQLVTIGSGPAITVGKFRLFGPSGSWASAALIDGQTGNTVWQLLDGYCNGASPGTFGVYEGGSAPLCITSSGVIWIGGEPSTFAQFGGSPCTVTSGGMNAASCSRSSAGEYTLTFSTAYVRTPICVANSIQIVPGEIPVVVDIAAATLTTVTVYEMESTTGTFVDGTVYLQCH